MRAASNRPSLWRWSEAAAALAAVLAAVGAADAAIASIVFKNQCAHEVNVFDGSEHFCDVRSGSVREPSFGCATSLPLSLAEYSHTGAANATSASGLP